MSTTIAKIFIVRAACNLYVKTYTEEQVKAREEHIAAIFNRGKRSIVDVLIGRNKRAKTLKQAKEIMHEENWWGYDTKGSEAKCAVEPILALCTVAEANGQTLIKLDHKHSMVIRNYLTEKTNEPV